jgi:hypothetical protein
MAAAVAVLLAASSGVLAAHDYSDALYKSILFFEGQRSGRLPPNQRLRWRRDSAIHDGAEAGVRTISFFYFLARTQQPLASLHRIHQWSML